MLKKLIIASLLAVTACNQPPTHKGADGYTFGHKQYDNQLVHVSFVIHRNNQTFQDDVKQHNGPPGTVAFTILKRDDPTSCEIHMIDPAIRYEPEYIGHELLHCKYGQWHTNNDSKG